MSKWLIYQGVIQTGSAASFVFLIVAMFGSALTLASFLKALYAVFLGQKSTVTAKVRGETSIAAAAPLVVLAALCVVFGVFYGFPLRAFISPALGGAAAPAGIWQSGLATILIVGGILLGLLVAAVAGLAGRARTAPIFIGGEHAGPREDSRPRRPLLRHDQEASPPVENLHGPGEGTPGSLWGSGMAGSAVSGALKGLHTGLLPWYLSWSVAGVVILICVFTFVR